MGHLEPIAPESGHETARFATFVANLETGELRNGGTPVPLQRQPFEILKMLLLARGRLVPRDALYNALWPGSVTVDFERGLTSAVRKVREALGDSGQSPQFIETLPGRGYRFICPVQFGSGTTDTFPAWPRLAAAVMIGLAAGIAVSTTADTRRGQAAAGASEARSVASRAKDPRSENPAAMSAWSAGIELIATGRESDLREASRLFSLAARFDPGFADAYAAGATARLELLSRGFGPATIAEDARDLAARALTLDPKSSRARVALATLDMQSSRFGEAATLLEAAIADDPQHTDALITLACLRKRQGRMSEAAWLADAAMSVSPGDSRLVALAGFYAHSAGRYDRERELLARAEEMAPASVDVLWHVALGEARRSDFDRALATLDRALVLAPDSPRLLYWKGYVEAAAGKVVWAQRTLSDLRRVAAHNKSNTAALASLQWIVERASS